MELVYQMEEDYELQRQQYQSIRSLKMKFYHWRKKKETQLSLQKPRTKKFLQLEVEEEQTSAVEDEEGTEDKKEEEEKPALVKEGTEKQELIVLLFTVGRKTELELYSSFQNSIPFPFFLTFSITRCIT